VPGAALAYASVVLVRKFARSVRQRLEFRESGIVYFDGVDRVELPWGDVNTIHVRLSDPLDKVLFGRKNYDVTINRGQSNEVAIGPEMKESEELTSTLREITARKICDRLYSKLVRGQHVSFGPIEVLPSGLMYRTQLLLWAEVAGAQLKDEKLIISERGTSRSREWARIDVESVPNADAFVRLVDRRGNHA
jgi:hypothetical protein